jgi:hypothetical protein
VPSILPDRQHACGTPLRSGCIPRACNEDYPRAVDITSPTRTHAPRDTTQIHPRPRGQVPLPRCAADTDSARTAPATRMTTVTDVCCSRRRVTTPECVRCSLQRLRTMPPHTLLKPIRRRTPPSITSPAEPGEVKERTHPTPRPGSRRSACLACVLLDPGVWTLEARKITH